MAERAVAFAAEHGHTVAQTARAGHASELAREALAEDCELIVAVGGDGTLNEIAGALLHTPATLGLVPCGSGNGLARHLGVYGPPRHIFHTLTHGTPRLIDAGLADGRPFFTAAGLGFEAEISARFNRLVHRGFLRYLTTSAALWREWAPLDCTIASDGATGERFRAFTVAVANSSQYGNNARIAPAASIDDGLLDWCVVPPVTAWNALSLLGRLFAGTLGRARGVTLRQASHLVVERPAPGLIHTDGETHPAGTRVEFSVRPRSLRVLVPGTVTAR